MDAADGRQPPSARHAQTSLWGSFLGVGGRVDIWVPRSSARGENLHDAGQCNCISFSLHVLPFSRTADLSRQRTYTSDGKAPCRPVLRHELPSVVVMTWRFLQNPTTAGCQLRTTRIGSIGLSAQWVQGCSQRGRDLSDGNSFLYTIAGARAAVPLLFVMDRRCPITPPFVGGTASL